VKVAPDIYRLTQGVSNFYLVEDGGKLTLVDAGAPGDWNQLVGEVAVLGRDLVDLEAVLLTHAHSDHVGFAERARTAAGSSVWVHEADAKVAKTAKVGKTDGKVTPYLFKAELYRTVFILLRRGGIKIVPVREVSTFADGETLGLPGRPRVVHLPGHTPGMSALFLEDRGVVLTGDALVTRNPLTGRRGPQIAPSGFNTDTNQAMRSLDTLGGVTADLVLPGHGEPWTEGVAEAVRLAKLAGRS